jgi:hypothetical protein
MIRARLAAIAIGLLIYVAVVFYPVVLAYTEWVGDRAVATVTGCHPSGRNQNCRGTWVGDDGQRHSGGIDEVYGSDIGKRVPIRIGPFGARAESTGSRIAYLAMLVGFGLVAPVGGIALARRMTRRMRAGGDGLLSSPVPSGTIRLFATHKRIWRPDGGEVAMLRPAQAPPLYSPVSPPGRVPHQRSGSALEAVRWLAYNPSKGARFLGAYNPGGVLMFLIHRPSAGSYAPETAVVDPGGATRLIVRRTKELPAAYALLAPDGRELGSINQADRMRPDYALRDEHGRQVGTLAIHRNRWIVQLEDDSPLRDAALAFAADSYRLRM